MRQPAFLLHHLMERATDARPQHPAVIDGQRSVSYLELEESSNRVANLLLAQGIGPGHRVALYLEKSAEAVVGIYGILKSGAAYVPLDPKAPAARVGYIVDNCAVSAVVCSPKQIAVVNEMVERTGSIRTILVLKPTEQSPEIPPARVYTPADLGEFPSTRPDVGAIDKDLAYILYTSGSTGQPKGVMLTHENALGFVDWAGATVRADPEDRFSSHAPFHFDLSVFDLYAAAQVGATVVLVPAAMSVFPTELVGFINVNRISVWYSVPSILTMMAEHTNLRPGDLPELRCVVFAGEVFPTKYLAKFMRLVPGAEFHNWYGPTETNVCTAYPVPGMPSESDGDIPIGQPIANVSALVLMEDGTAARDGEVGELLIRGCTVMQGYWGDAAKTGAKLVDHPHDANVGGRFYRTGDLVARQPDGNYRFLGRKDHQIKSRGYRIELGEIETAINAHPEVVECAVTAIPDPMISNRIVAFVVTKSEIESRALAGFCGERIPAYMIPEAFEFRTSLPKTSTGKIDRQSLQS